MKRFGVQKAYLVFTLIMSVFISILPGCGGGGGGVWKQPVSVTSTVPGNAATVVPIGNKLTVTFSGAMDPATINTTTFTLKDGNTPVSGKVDYSGVTAVFTPTGNLAAGTVFTATITTGAKTQGGNALANDYGWNFTTGTATDTALPTVSSTIPVNAATGVATNSAVTATFSEAMDPATINATTFTVKQGAANVPGNVTYSGVTAVFTPTSTPLAAGSYTATITTGAKDLGNNALAADKVWNFTIGAGAVADTIPPTVMSTLPLDLAINVAGNTAVTATFSEAMVPLTTATFTIKETVAGTNVPGTVNSVGSSATFTPNPPFTAGLKYTATITTGAKDLAVPGNALAANKVWSFTVGAAADIIPPTVISTIPLDLATGVATNSTITANFSEAMVPLTTATFTIKETLAGTNVPGTVNSVGSSATFTPNPPLTAGLNYTATITTGAKDLAVPGNALAVNKVWNFTVAAALPLLANPTAPVLGEAGRFVILASQAVSTTSGSTISNGDIGVEDQARSFITGFTAGAVAGQFTELANGMSYAPNDINPAPFAFPLHFATPVVGAPWATTGAMLTQAKTDLGIANTFLSAATNPSSPTQVCPTQLGGLVLNRGFYLTASNVSITTGPLHLDAQGDPNAIFIFTMNGTLTTGALGNIILDNGAQAKNVYWRTAGITTIAANTFFKGNVFAATQVNVLGSADVTGRLFAVTDRVTLISNIVTMAP